MKSVLVLVPLFFSSFASASDSPYCGNENFASPECRQPARPDRRHDTRNGSYSYCNTGSDNWARGYFECRTQSGRWVRVPAPRYVPNCDGSESFGSAGWWACRDNGR